MHHRCMGVRLRRNPDRDRAGARVTAARIVLAVVILAALLAALTLAGLAAPASPAPTVTPSPYGWPEWKAPR
jgi:hypothetical protein